MRVPLPAGTLCVTDLHLDLEAGGDRGALVEQPDVEAFLRFLDAAEGAPALVILGDLFEFWLGPSHVERARPVLERLRGFGGDVHLVPGNRDVLAGDELAAFGIAVHREGFVGCGADGGPGVLCVHSDELCVADRGYQRYRRVLRAGPVWTVLRALPHAVGRRIAQWLRGRSRSSSAAKAPLAVGQDRALAAERLADHGAALLLAGHTHRFVDEELAGGGRLVVLDAFDPHALGGEPFASARDTAGVRDLARLGWSADGPVLELMDARAFSAASPGVAGGEGARLGAVTPLSSPAPDGTRDTSVSGERRPLVVALDGPAGAGKSTVARGLADELGVRFLDTGAMYRALTHLALERGIAPGDAEALTALAGEVVLDFDARGRVLADGVLLEPAVRSAEVTRAVSEVSAHGGVREAVVARQREFGRVWEGLVAEGRDTTTVVFPDAAHRFYLDASAAERARRRAAELGTPEDVAAIQADIERRDAYDSGRAHSPLRLGQGVTVIDTDGRTPGAVVALLLAELGER